MAKVIAFKLKDSDWNRTLKYIDNSEIEARNSTNKKVNLAIHYETIADIYYSKEVLDVALEYYQNAYNFYLETDNIVKKRKLENDLAIIYARLNNKRKAIYYFNKIYYYQVKIKDSVQLIKVLNNIGTLYLKSNLDSSEYYYKKALKITEKINNIKLNAYVYTNLGRIYLNKNNLIKSKYYFNKSESLTSKKLNNDLKSFIYQSISQYYFNLKQYDSAIYYSNQSKLLIHNKNSFLYLDNLKTLYKSNIAKGFYKEASTYFETYDKIRDSINVEEKLVNVERLKLKQEYKLKEQLQKIKNDKKKFNYYLVGLSLIIGLLILTIILIQFRNKLLRSQLEK